MAEKRSIEPSDILDADAYAAIRKQRKAEMIAHKKLRRLAVGPNATLHFESYQTMLYQIQEMLHTERGGDAQMTEEIEAYAPLVPKGNELVTTMMLEYEDATIRHNALSKMGGIEETVALEFDGGKVQATWEADIDRTTPEGKTSSVHFLHFPFTPEQAESFKKEGTRVVISINHENYGHMAVVPEAVRAEVAQDL
ncbi:MAG: DUF3501 family protein [Magnetospiraceae bacterium]